MKRIPMAMAVALFSATFVAYAQSGGPNDAQISAIVVTANQVDIDAGKLAESKAKHKDVKAIGKMMVTDHTGVNKSAKDMVTKLKDRPEDNPSSERPKKGGQEDVQQRREQKG